MINAEHELRKFFEGEAESIDAPSGMGVAVMRRARVRRVVTAAAAVGLVACLGVLSVAGIKLVSRDGRSVPVGPTGREEESPEPRRELVHTDGDVIVRLGPGWELADENLTPMLTEPGELFSAGTGPMPDGGKDCATVPEAAIEAMAPDDALVSVQEEGGTTEGFPERPQSFAWEDGQQSTFQSCIEGGASLRGFRFRDGGRGFYAYVAVGSEASSERVDEALEILNSLVICDENAPRGDCP
jgi:hypothetical protein